MLWKLPHDATSIRHGRKTRSSVSPFTLWLITSPENLKPREFRLSVRSPVGKTKNDKREAPQNGRCWESLGKRHLPAWENQIPQTNRGTKAVRINTIRVPAAVENGTSSVILDCDYSIPCEEQTGLVVHWFWNKHPEPVYQWIPHKPPQGLGPLRGRINLQYKVSNDPCSSHRAMDILNPSPQLSGEYRCKISTWDSEDTASSNMIVYVREQSLTVSHSEVRVSGQVNVTCHVQGIFPEPTLELTQADDSSGDRKPLLDGTLRTFQRNGLFDATLFKLIDAKDLRKDTTFECTAKLEGTPYRTSEKSSIVSSGSSHHSKAVDHSGSWISSTRDPSMQDSSNELWQSTGRGIRAHDPPTTLVDSGSSVASFSLALFLLCASTIVVVSSCQLPLTS